MNRCSVRPASKRTHAKFFSAIRFSSAFANSPTRSPRKDRINIGLSPARGICYGLLLCQGLLNHESLEKYLEQFGRTMTMPADYTELLTGLATACIRPLLSDLMQDRDYADKV